MWGALQAQLLQPMELTPLLSHLAAALLGIVTYLLATRLRGAGMVAVPPGARSPAAAVKPQRASEKSELSGGPVGTVLLQTIGGTPMVKLGKITEGCVADVYAKLDYTNPGALPAGCVVFCIVLGVECRGCRRAVSAAVAVAVAIAVCW